MSFVSWQYALFLPAVVLLYWQLPWRGRILLLLAASYFFYGAWDARFLALLLTTTVVDYFGVRAIAGHREPLLKLIGIGLLPLVWLLCCLTVNSAHAAVARWVLLAAALFPLTYALLYQGLWSLPARKQRRAFLLLSLGSNLSVLGFFKYFNFFADSLGSLLEKLGWHPGWTLLHIILPVGISFYTFQSISYAVDVYRAIAKPADDFLTFAAFVSFFPQLVAGPIERCNDLLPQLQKQSAFDIAHVHRGLRLILVGLFKKIYVADNCAVLANYAFDPRTALNAPWALLGVLAFAFQIYGDFSGYTDIARGSARLLGIHLNRNFQFPYFATRPSDFWRRWHITLSFWFRDYVYIPLGGNRAGPLGTLRNLWITMLLAGLWHGANWTFVLWGAYYAALLTLYRAVPGLDDWAAPPTSLRGSLHDNEIVHREHGTSEGRAPRAPLFGDQDVVALRPPRGRFMGSLHENELAHRDHEPRRGERREPHFSGIRASWHSALRKGKFVGRKVAATALMFAFTLVGWAIFRSKSLGQLGGWFAALGHWHAAGGVDWVKPCAWWLLHAGPLLLLQAATWKAGDEVEFSRFPWWVRGLIYTLLLLLVAASTSSDVDFIYFQF